MPYGESTIGIYEFLKKKIKKKKKKKKKRRNNEYNG